MSLRVVLGPWRCIGKRRGCWFALLEAGTAVSEMADCDSTAVVALLIASGCFDGADDGSLLEEFELVLRSVPELELLSYLSYCWSQKSLSEPGPQE